MNRLFKILFFLLLPVSLAGQLAPVTDQYVLNPLLINPAFAGSRKALNIGTFYRRQWVGVPGSPETMIIAVDAPMLDDKLGLGFMLVNDKFGVSDEKHFISDYAYKINLGDGILSLGLGAGIITTYTAYSQLIALDPGDDYYQINSKIYVVPTFSFGAYYTYHNYFAGFSIPKFLNYKFNFDKNKYKLVNDPSLYTYMLTTGYLFPVSRNVKFMPSTLLTYSPGEKILYDLNAYFSFYDRFWVGASYWDNRTIAAMFQFQLSSQFKLAYSYDFDIGKLGKYSNGSHGIMLRYEFRYKVQVVNPLVF